MRPNIARTKPRKTGEQNAGFCSVPNEGTGRLWNVAHPADEMYQHSIDHNDDPPNAFVARQERPDFHPPHAGKVAIENNHQR